MERASLNIGVVRDWRFKSLALGTAFLLYLSPVKRVAAEDRVELKINDYTEDGDRMHIFSPLFLYQQDLTPDLSIKVDGIYNAISGASPTGAPASPVIPAYPSISPVSSPSSAPSTPSSPGVIAPVEPGEEEEADEEDRRVNRWAMPASLHWHGKAGATQPAPSPTPTPAPSSPAPSSPAGSPAPTPSSPSPSPSTPVIPVTQGSSGKVPTAPVDDTRYGINVELAKRIENQTVAGQVSVSTESDFQSVGLALRDAIDFNQKNTTLLIGGALTHDQIDVYYRNATETKDSVDFLVGVSQVLDPKTLLTLNLTYGQVDGFLSDPYKVAEVNGVLVPENRPDQKDKQIAYLSLIHFFDQLNGSLDASYRYYQDSYGIRGGTAQLAWFQKIGDHFVLSPMVRLYNQSAADFYAVRFAGAPENYSADYRLSELSATSWGLKLIWTPKPDLSIDVGFERYIMEGGDGVTADDAYPSANLLSLGIKLWF